MEGKKQPIFRSLVVCWTYNQSRYISDTMNGFVMQKTEFPYLCCIIDDASTDGEQALIRRYVHDNFYIDEVSGMYETEFAFVVIARHKENHNCHFSVLFLKYNHYSINKDKSVYLSEWIKDVEYLSFCEGDDYWIDPNKLQKQVTYLDSHHDCGLCYSSVIVYNQRVGSFTSFFGGSGESFDNLLGNNTIPTPTVMIRAELEAKYLAEILPESRGWSMGDYPRWLWFAYNSKIRFIDEITAVYRELPESASHSDDYRKRIKFANSYVEISSFFAQKYGFRFDRQRALNHVAKKFCRACVDKGAFELSKEFSRNIVPKSLEDVILLYVLKNDKLLSLYRFYRSVVR